jgi:hypothetical protein
MLGVSADFDSVCTMYVYLCTYVYTYIYMYIYTYIHTYICNISCRHAGRECGLHVFDVHIAWYIEMGISTYAHKHIYTIHMHTYRPLLTHKYINTYTHIQVHHSSRTQLRGHAEPAGPVPWSNRIRLSHTQYDSDSDTYRSRASKRVKGH